MDEEEKSKGKVILNIVIFILLLLINFATIMSRSISNLDEIWNYNMANQIVQGLIPYKDISMVITPFSQFLLAPALLIFNSIFTFRVAGIILSTLISYIAYDIIKKITQSRMIGFIFVLIAEYLLLDLFTYDYNFLCLLLGEIALDLEITKYLKRRQNFEDMINFGSIYRKAEKKTYSERHQYLNYDIAIGLMAGLCICTKQTVGILMAIAVLLIAIIERKFAVAKDDSEKKKAKEKKNNKNKTKKKKDKEQTLSKSEDELYINASENKDFKTRKRKSVTTRLIAIIVPCIVLLIYLIFTQSLSDFISYTVLGIREFTNSVSYWHLIEEGGSALISILAVTLPAYLILSIIFLIYADKDRPINNVLKLLMIYSIPFFILIYPIADKMHFYIGMYILLISVPFSLKFAMRDLLSNADAGRRELASYIISTILFMVFIVLIGKNLGQNVLTIYSNREKTSQLKHFEYLYVEDYLDKRIEETNAKIGELRQSGAEIYILDSEAAIYNIVKDEYYKDYDMFNRGNFGKDGENRILQKIKDSHNTYYFVRNRDIGLNWQTPKDIVNEIRTYEFKGKMGLFELYYKE